MNRKIMLVDDEEIILKSMHRDLSLEGFEVTKASGGEEALEKFRKNPCELVITDLAMPGMDGIKVLKKIKEISPTTGVIILTGFGDLNSAIDALRLGADDYLLKPCDARELVIRIKNCLGKQDNLQKISIYEKILPVCCVCGLIRDDSEGKKGEGKWLRGDQYLAKKTDAKTSHTYCPECYAKAIKNLG